MTPNVAQHHKGLYRATCEGKTRYDRRTAELVARVTNTRNRRRRRMGEGKVNAFACRFCGGWHIGSLGLVP